MFDTRLVNTSLKVNEYLHLSALVAKEGISMDFRKIKAMPLLEIVIFIVNIMTKKVGGYSLLSLILYFLNRD